MRGRAAGPPPADSPAHQPCLPAAHTTGMQTPPACTNWLHPLRPTTCAHLQGGRQPVGGHHGGVRRHPHQAPILRAAHAAREHDVGRVAGAHRSHHLAAALGHLQTRGVGVGVHGRSGSRVWNERGRQRRRECKATPDGALAHTSPPASSTTHLAHQRLALLRAYRRDQHPVTVQHVGKRGRHGWDERKSWVPEGGRRRQQGQG